MNKSRKFLFLLLASLSFFWNCQNQTKEEKKTEQEQIEGNEKQLLEETKTLSLPFVAVVNNETTQIEIQENPQKSKVPLNKEELAEALNIKYPEIHLEVDKISHDTLSVNIPNATYLTQQAGTTGAMTYLAEATYAFTDLPEIKVVTFNFKEGDHAVPGPYSRNSFNKKNI